MPMKIVRYIAFGLMAVTLLVGLLGCAREMPPEEQPVTDEVVMTVKEGSVTEDGLVLQITNNTTDYQFVFGEIWRIERYEDGKWVDLRQGETVSANAVAHYVQGGSSKEMELQWKAALGNLKPGEYRVAKNFQKKAADEQLSDKVIEEYVLYARFSLE